MGGGLLLLALPLAVATLAVAEGAVGERVAAGVPPEVTELRMAKIPGGGLEASFDELVGAQRYNLYFGHLSSLPEYDHGATPATGPFCDMPTLPAGPGRLSILVGPATKPSDSAYILVTAHAGRIESPAGQTSNGVEIDPHQSICD